MSALEKCLRHIYTLPLKSVQRQQKATIRPGRSASFPLRCRSNDCILPLFPSFAVCKRARGGLPHRARVDKHRPEKLLPSSLVPSPRRRSIASCDLRGCMTLSLRSPSAMARRTVRRSVRTKSKTDQVCGAKPATGHAVSPSLEQERSSAFHVPVWCARSARHPPLGETSYTGHFSSFQAISQNIHS